jgi:hypothetical protein
MVKLKIKNKKIKLKKKLFFNFLIHTINLISSNKIFEINNFNYYLKYIE